MGIRFYCPKGHKLNVKSELAGKIGICPKCGERMLIPLISTRKSGESRHVPQEENNSEPPVAAPPASPETSAFPSANEAFGGPEFANDPVALPGSGVNEWESDQATQTSAIPLVNTSEEPNSYAGQPAWGTAEQPADNAPATPPTASVPGSGSLLNDPEVLWYVRTPDNQSYGPATSPVIQSWIQEKRIGPHMLVWREGWSSWLEAGNVFPELEAVFTSPGLDPFPVSPVNRNDDLPVVVSPSASDEKRTTRRKKAKRDLLIVACLIVVIIALIAGLIVVLVLQQRSVNTTGETSAVTSVVQPICNIFPKNLSV